jgi:hypothetical protein
VNNMPRLKLADLLRRRKMSLHQLLDEFGITTYEGLVIRCGRMGVTPPPEADFKVAHPDKPVNSPQEGVVVLEPPPVVDEISGRKIDPEAPVAPEVRVITEPVGQLLPNDVLFGETGSAPSGEPTDPPQKKPRRKKEATQGE